LILDDILTKLENDNELKLLLNATNEDTRIYLGYADKTDSITYKYSNLTSDGIKEQSRLEISCLSKDYVKANQILDRAKSILLTVGDNQFNDNVMEIALNGGGYLFEDDTNNHIIKAIFIIKSRYRRK